MRLRSHRRRRSVLPRAAIALTVTLLVGGISVARAVSADTVVRLDARADAYVARDLPWLQTGGWGFAVAGRDVTAMYTRFIKIRPGFTKAELRVRAVQAVALQAALVSSDWNEHAITWSNAPYARKTPVANGRTTADNQWVAIDVTELVAPNAFDVSFRVVAPQVNGVMLGTRESGWAPQLVLSYGAGSTTTTAPSTTAQPTTTAAPTTAVTTTRPVTTVVPTTTRPGATTTAPATTTTVNHSTHGPGVYADPARIPTGDVGTNQSLVVPATYSTILNPGDRTGAFRVNCRFSHMRYDDPIVYPGQSGRSHLHQFFGNTAVTANSTSTSVLTTGNSTCTGGTANRSAYWAPSIIDTSTNTPVTAGTTQGDIDNALQVYYKTGYDGVLPQTVQNFPVGLRMIAGSALSSGPQEGIVRYHCAEPDTQGTPAFQQCPPGSLFVMSVSFPQCWDGVNLDSPDHKSHMAYGAGWPDRGCPSSHPVPLPQITQNYRYRVPATGMANWRLASDVYTGIAGYSGHADWMNGWNRPIFQRVVDNCYQPGLDCSMNLLGDGTMLG